MVSYYNNNYLIFYVYTNEDMCVYRSTEADLKDICLLLQLNLSLVLFIDGLIFVSCTLYRIGTFLVLSEDRDRPSVQKPVSFRIFIFF